MGPSASNGAGAAVRNGRPNAQSSGGDARSRYGIGNRTLENERSRQPVPRPQPTSVVDQAELILREKLRLNFSDLRSAFRALDRSDNGYVSKADFMEAMAKVFLPSGFSRDDLVELAGRFDLNRDGFISFNEFTAYIDGQDLEKAAELEPVRNTADRVDEVDVALVKFKQSIDKRFTSMKAAFLSMTRKPSLDRDDFSAALIASNIRLSPECEEELRRRFDEDNSGQITYSSFCKVVSQ